MTSIIGKLFRIGRKPIVSDFYCPIFFRKGLSITFLNELYSRAFWLFSKTKREMKISIKDDYKVVSLLSVYYNWIIIKIYLNIYRASLKSDAQLNLNSIFPKINWNLVDHTTDIKAHSLIEMLSNCTWTQSISDFLCILIHFNNLSKVSAKNVIINNLNNANYQQPTLYAATSLQ